MSAILYLFYAVLIIATLKLLAQLFLSLIYNWTRRSRELRVFPKISIVVPAYNEAKTIASCIESLQNLDYPNYEIIVVDDGSTDETFEEASNFGVDRSIIEITLS
jgi:cellulose synthase/poly-beta-1,6-N-acetylglucosamine synthase-like glycosyltransferase